MKAKRCAMCVLHRLIDVEGCGEVPKSPLKLDVAAAVVIWEVLIAVLGDQVLLAGDRPCP